MTPLSLSAVDAIMAAPVRPVLRDTLLVIHRHNGEGIGQERIADAIHVSTRTAFRALQKLTQLGYIEQLPRQGSNSPDRYRIITENLRSRSIT